MILDVTPVNWHSGKTLLDIKIIENKEKISLRWASFLYLDDEGILTNTHFLKERAHCYDDRDNGDFKIWLPNQYHNINLKNKRLMISDGSGYWKYYTPNT